jgi:hypothetical protein
MSDTATKLNTNLFESVRGDIKAFVNIAGILDKIHYDENFALMSRCFLDIFDFEISYAVSGWLTRAREDEEGEPRDRHHQPARGQHQSLQGEPEGHRVFPW